MIPSLCSVSSTTPLGPTSVLPARPHSRARERGRGVWPQVLALAMLVACSGDDLSASTGSGASSSSSGGDFCPDCLATLVIDFADGREDFELSLELDNLEATLRCPAGDLETNIVVAELTCEGSTARLNTSFISWDGTLALSTATEMWSEEIVRGELVETSCHMCYSGSVSLE